MKAGSLLVISATQHDGNPTHALIVAPAATGATGTGYTLTTKQAVENRQHYNRWHDQSI
jgi:hypothetical protein